MRDQQTGQILVVEDDEHSRRALTNVLEDQGYPVTACDSCEAALEYLRQSPRPELILLDLMMEQGMEGWEFRHIQKQTPELAGIPVISVSAVGKLVDVDIALRKPLDYDDLLSAVARYIPRPPRGRTGRPKITREADDRVRRLRR